MIDNAIKQTNVYKELLKTCENYHTENCKKEERIRKLKKENKQLKEENERLKEKLLNGENHG